MTPTERAKRAITDSDLEECITAAVQAERNAGDLRLADATAALQAALEDLAKAYSDLTSEQIAHGKTMKERDELAHHLRFHCPDCHGTGAVETAGPEDGQVELVDCERCVPAKAILAAHDRQVAARVLRREAAEWRKSSDITHRAFAAGLIDSAEEYEAGEREVPK